MADDLIQRLRKCLAEVHTPCNQIEAAALELGRSGTSEAVEELIRIADGGEFTPEQRGKRHWFSSSYTLLSESRWEYGSNNQLAAIEALGETGSAKALEYLTKLSEYRISVKYGEDDGSGWGGSLLGYFPVFPNIRGELLHAMKGDRLWPHSIQSLHVDTRADIIRDASQSESLGAIKQWIENEGGLHAHLVKYKDSEQDTCKQLRDIYTIIHNSKEKLKATTTKEYNYGCYNVDEYPNMFDDAHRRPEYGEKGDITYVILHPYQPYDDDSMLLRWNSRERRWNMSFSLGIGGGKFPDGEYIGNGGDLNERAGLALLGHFGLMARRNEFSPEKLGYISPEQLQQLGNDIPKKRPA